MLSSFNSQLSVCSADVLLAIAEKPDILFTKFIFSSKTQIPSVMDGAV